jgi:hypothetical protein
MPCDGFNHLIGDGMGGINPIAVDFVVILKGGRKSFPGVVIERGPKVFHLFEMYEWDVKGVFGAYFLN